MLLDNMPLDSYIEKGLLLNLYPLLEEVGQNEPLFSNITEAVKKDGTIYAMPCEIRIPVMLADKKYISGVQDIEDIADMVNGVFSVFDYWNGYNMFTSIQKVEGFEGTEWTTMKGQCGNVFWAETLLGFSTASNHRERAEDFVKMCLGKENQTSLYYGPPVNTVAFEEYMKPDGKIDEFGRCGSYILSNDEGLYVHLEIFWPDETLLAEFRKCMEELDTAYLKNDLIEYAVYDVGIAYMQGTKSLDEAMEGIEKKISLYMAE